MPTYLVTGGGGFIGSHLTDKLISSGAKVIVIDNLSAGKKKNIHPKALFFHLNINDKKIETIFKKHSFDGVFHLAAQKSINISIKNPLYDADINITGGLHILEKCVKYRVKKFIFTSSGGAVYGNAKTIPTPETHRTKPTSPYGISKLALEHYLDFYYHAHRLSYATLRLANVYGTNQDPEGEGGVVSILIHKVLNDQEVIIHGDGEQTRDYIHVSDVVSALITAIKNNKTGSYNIGTGKETSVNELFEYIVKLSGKQTKKKHDFSNTGGQRKSCLDIKYAKKELDWKPKIQLEEGIKKMLHNV